MLVSNIKENYPLVYQCLVHIADSDGPGPVDGSREFPNIYKGIAVKKFLGGFNSWLKQFDGKKTGAIICPQDFKDYLGWKDTDWDLYDSRDDWENIYSQESSIEAFASSESSVMDVIELKYNGEIYSDFLIDCFNGDIPVFSGFTPNS